MAAKNRASFAALGSTKLNCGGMRKSAANANSTVACDVENCVAAAIGKKSCGLAVQKRSILPKNHQAIISTKSTTTTTTRMPLGQLTNNVRMVPALARQKPKCPQKFPTSNFTIHVDVEDDVPSGCSVYSEVSIVDAKSTAQPPDTETVLTKATITDDARGRALVHDASLMTESPMLLDDTSSCSESTKLEDDDDEDKENNAPCSEDSAQDKSSTTVAVVEEDVSASLYSASIYAYLRRLELVYRPKPKYMLKQPDITNGMRSILVDWLVEVAEEYVLQPETLFLAVGYIDRFLSCMSVLRTKLQLVGAACMLVAAKFEEIYPPEVKEFVYITDDTYTRQQMLRMEQVVLRVLSFGLATPTMHYFVNRYCVMGGLDGLCRNLAMYLCELSLLEADPYLQFVPSIIAGSAVCLACHTLDLDSWNESLREQSGYAVDDFRQCLPLLYKSYVSAPHYQQQSVRTKYTSKKFSEVATIAPPMNLPI